ncbi:MAG TPA: hypothetical protein DHV42_08325 [Lachnospiraceae bacterium]|nr:hypothetical protein [Lachnospiraceae bacterium]
MTQGKTGRNGRQKDAGGGRVELEKSRMQERREKHYAAQENRLKVDFITDRGQYHAAHWDSDLEIIYLLNGNAAILLDGAQVQLVQGEFIVIDAGRIFELQCKESFMQIRVRVDKEFLSARAGDLSRENSGQGEMEIMNRRYSCQRDTLKAEQLEHFLEICELFKSMVPLYISEPAGFRLKTESIVLEILYLLVRHFSEEVRETAIPEVTQDLNRIREILAYIEDHYQEPISLMDISSEFGLSREYFSRLFHKSIGMTFTDHLTRVRIAHFYHDLTTTDAPVMKLLEENGLTNYKHFRKNFKELYGYSPRDLRKVLY